MGTGMTKGGRDFLLLGDFNVMCAYCGRKRKASELKRDNDFARGLWCCPEHADDRHPQEYARGVKENMAAPFVQPPLVAFTQLATDFPVSINPYPVQLTPQGQQDIVTEGFFVDITTELGQPLVTEAGNYAAVVVAQLPNWIINGPVGDPTTVYVTSILWDWAIGGVGINIVSPNLITTLIYTTNPLSFGTLRVTITNSLGATAVAVVPVTG